MIWGFGIHWRFLTGVWHLDHVLVTVTGLWYTTNWILALYHDFEGTKNIHFLKVEIFGFGGNWWFLTKVWHLDLGLNMVDGLWYTHVPNFGSLS